VSQATPVVTNIATALRRTLFATSGAGQHVGVALNGASDRQFFRSSGVSDRGGWYFAATFMIDVWPGNASRLFVGMCDATAGNVCLADVAGQAGEIIGLYHDTADNGTTFSTLTKGVSASTKNALTAVNGGPVIATGQAFLWEMQIYPGTSLVYCSLKSINSGLLVASNQTGSGPNISTLVGPQVELGNAAAGAGTLGLANILVGRTPQ
jgi:hypothetical protein